MTQLSIQHPRFVDARAAVELLTGLVLLLALTGWLNLHALGVLAGVAVYLAMAALLLGSLPRSLPGLGWANRVTLLRGVLICAVAGNLTAPPSAPADQWLIAGLVLAALALDGVDGWVARRTSTASVLGARFDMELDAFLILVLCLWLVVSGAVGAWVLAVGGMRYAFLLAGLRWRWLAAPLPESRRRKAVCVWQVSALLIAITPIADATTSTWLAASALATLVLSFAADIHRLYRQASS